MDGRLHIMGIVNLTPDSFYEGSRVKGSDALRRAEALWAEGADVVDLGACSTRPGASQPSPEEEWARLEPALQALAASGQACCGEGMPRLSIDTYRASIVERAYALVGPFLVNDISAGALDARMLSTVGRLGLPYVAMHLRGTPQDMLSHTDYDGDLLAHLKSYFRAFARQAAAAGIRQWLLDPGFGFSKTLAQNYELLRRLDELQELGRPILVGLSRKSMVYKALGITPEEAMPATQLVQFAALERGARWLRVHDVAAARQTLRLYSTMYTSSPGAAK